MTNYKNSLINYGSLKNNTIAQLREAKNYCELMDIFSNKLKIYNVEGWAFTLQDLPASITPTKQMGTFEQAFIDSYMSENLYEYDLVLHHIQRSINSIFLTDIEAHLKKSPVQTPYKDGYKEIIKINRSYGYDDTYSIPLLTSTDKSRVVLSLASRGINTNSFRNFMTINKNRFEIIADSLYIVGSDLCPNVFVDQVKNIKKFIQSQPVNLLLTMIKYDLSMRECAKKMNISQSTANKHVIKVREFLGVKTNIAAAQELKKYLPPSQ